MILIADSGSTKTDWCMADGGRVVKRMATQGINPFHCGEDDILGVLTGELLPQMGDEEPQAVYFYGSGCRDEYVAAVGRLLAHVFPHTPKVEVESDLAGAARALFGRTAGIACILGTGSNSCLYDGAAVAANVPPLGYILGDEGSGAVLGRMFVNALYKGRLGASLRESFEGETGLRMPEIARRTYREPQANRFLASLSPFIHRHIVDGGLRSLVTDNFRSFFRNNVKAYGRPELAVGVVGSIGYYYSAELSDAAEAEGVALGCVVRSPMDGLVRYHS